MKRYIYIIIGIVIIAAIAVAVLFFIKNNSTGAPAGGSGTTTGTLPITGTQGSSSTGITTGGGVSAPPLGLTASAGSSTPSSNGQTVVQNFGVLSSNPVIDYFTDVKNNITAIEPTGQVFMVSNGQSTVINSSTINDIISASFSYDGKMIVVSYGNPSNPQGGIFNVATNAWTALPRGMQSPQWSPINNYQLSYLITTNSGGVALATLNAASLKTAPSILLTLNASALMLQWPTKSEFILADKPTSQNAGSIWSFNATTGVLTSLAYEVPSAEGIWSHDAAIPYGLIFFANPANQGDTLQLQSIAGNLPTQPITFQTLPTKCVFNPEQMLVATSTTASGTPSTTSSTTKIVSSPKTPTSTPYLALYCGIPRSSSGFSSARLPDDYNMMALFTSDDIYKINTQTGGVQILWSDAAQNMDVSDVKFFNNALFFVNRYDQKLYGLTFSG